MNIQTLPLFCLTLSSLNVRRTERDADIAALAEDIEAAGLKQNLVVIPAHFSTAETTENYGDKFEVIAGGRRYQALRLLAEDGRIEHDFPVPVLVEHRDAAQQTSLSENLHRVAMNPADEFDAFAAIVAKLAKDGMAETEAVAATAKRFGVTVKHVEGRLRLAALAPEILEALRKGAISLDSAKAYAGSTDHKLQLKVFLDQCKANAWNPHNPPQVRQQLRGVTLSLTDIVVKFVGLDAYRAAGGRTETEMFMGTDGEERLLDVKLLEKLAREKGEPLAGPQAKADGFKAGIFVAAAAGYARTPKAPDGLVEHRGWDPTPGNATLKKSTAVYAIGSNGLKRTAMFVPRVEKKVDAAPARDWKAEQRADEIERHAAQLIKQC